MDKTIVDPGAEIPAEVDLGHGVRLRSEHPCEWVLVSEHLPLPFAPRAGRFPGTGVDWQEQLFEVVGREVDGGEQTLRLAPWRPGETARTVFPLSREWVAKAAADGAEAKSKARIRSWLVLIMPLSGLLPRTIQMRLEREVGFPAQRASTVSALCEMPFGGLGLVQAMIYAFSSEWILPPPLRWLILVGPILFAEALVRLKFTFSQGEPMGSVLLAPLNLFEDGPTPPRAEDLRPAPVEWDPEAGVLVLATSEGRPDWSDGGILRYRDRSFQLVNRVGHSSTVNYHFEAVADDQPATLQLLPPPKAEVPRAESPSLPTMLWRTLLMSFAPGRYQETWFRRYGTSPLLATVITAAVEGLGGAFNMVARPSSGLAGITDLLIFTEGLLRLVLALIGRRPVGSLLGLPLQPLYRRWTEAPRRSE